MVGVVAALAAWAFLELVVHIQEWVFTDLPEAFGYDNAPRWWSLAVLAVAGLITAWAIVRLPGRGGHIPAEGLNPAPTQPIAVPGVIAAGLASIGLGGARLPLVLVPGLLASGIGLAIAFKGLAYAISLGSFRGGPVFPAMFLGAAAGVMAGQLPGFSETPAVAVGIGAGVVSVLGLPLSATVLAVLLTSSAGPGTAPLIIIGVIVAYLIKLTLAAAVEPEPAAQGA